MTNNTLADIICRWRVGIKKRIRKIKVINTKFTLELLIKLQKEGLIAGFQVLKEEILILIKYEKNKTKPYSIEMISTPGKRRYWKLNNLNKKVSTKSNNEVYIISTSKGLKTSNECILGKNICGEILLKIKV